jgi:hypothetical protein
MERLRRCGRINCEYYHGSICTNMMSILISQPTASIQGAFRAIGFKLIFLQFLILTRSTSMAGSAEKSCSPASRPLYTCIGLCRGHCRYNKVPKVYICLSNVYRATSSAFLCVHSYFYLEVDIAHENMAVILFNSETHAYELKIP